MACSVYIHIPFCLKKCVYCDFVSVPFDGVLSDRYLAALGRELSLSLSLSARGKSKMRLKTLFVGGGTPTALSAWQLKGLFDSIGRGFDFYPDAEVTVEANPATLDEEKLGVLLQGGVNRISIGAQSFDAEELKLLGRAHRPGEISDAVELCRAAGLENIGLDLIYGIPGQKMQTWLQTLKSALELGPRHISAYELTVEEKTGLWDLVRGGALEMPSEDDVLSMSGAAQEALEAAGFVRYEVSNYAIAGFECRHNLNYWRRGEYLGLGVAAHSFSDGRRWSNTCSVLEYIAAIEAGELPVAGAETLTKDEQRREVFLLGLRTGEGVPLAADGAGGAALERAAAELIAEGLLEVRRGRLSATRRGFHLLDSVIFRLLAGLSL
ncbi:MAG: radical SAM family heme chaperone HemW [Nitrospiraceae bacterium]|nr:radical SAM family heme chaperone HemW [Nitrospiraceae bacterium]